jgi:uncharacterized protein YecA (UPF0149 family)
MDDRNGQIYSPEQMNKMFKDMRTEERNHFKEMAIPPTNKQMLRVPPKIGRNEICPCGSGKKFKNCCWTGGASA